MGAPEYAGARFTPATALEVLAELRAANVAVLGADGFVETMQGVISPLELCLDVSGGDVPTSERPIRVEAFIRQHTLATSWELVW